MTYSNSVLVASPAPSLLHLPSGGLDSSAADECIALAAQAGLLLDLWQCDILDGALAARRGGKWAAFEVAEIVPRQNGKNAVIEARQLAGLFLFGERLQVHTAHEYKTTLEHFLRIKQLIEVTPDLDRHVKIIRTGSADMSIELIGGARLRFVARTKSSGRGLSGDVVYLDEAFALSAAMLGALVPTMRARPNPQLWYASSSPKHDSAFLHGLLKRAEDPTEKRLYLIAWENPAGTPLDDREAWWRVNPTMGSRITEEAMADELRLLGTTEDGLAEFARECMGIREEPTTRGQLRREIAPSVWAKAIDVRSKLVGQVVFAVDAAVDGEAASIAVHGHRGDGRGHVEVVDAAAGVAWVEARLDGLLKSWQPAAVGVDAGGPVAMLLPDIERVCKTNRVKLVKLPTRAYAAACGEFVEALNDDRVRHLDQAWLNTAVSTARRRTYGDVWVWDRRMSGDVAPLVAATIARRVWNEISPVVTRSIYEDEQLSVV